MLGNVLNFSSEATKARNTRFLINLKVGMPSDIKALGNPIQANLT